MSSPIRQLITFLRRRRADARERKAESAWAVHRAEVLSRWIPQGGTGAELGVHKGYLSPILLERLAPRKLYLIDPWYLSGHEWSWGWGNCRTIDALCRVLLELQDELVRGRVVLQIDYDWHALQCMPDGHLDWVYVDTTHDYGDTVKELELLRVKVRPGGVIAGDDWREDPSHVHHGVCKAVREFVQRENCRLFADSHSLQWAVELTANVAGPTAEQSLLP